MEVIAAAMDADVSSAELRQLMLDCEGSTQIDGSVILRMETDLRCLHPDHGRLSTPDAVAQALQVDLERGGGHLMFADGAFWLYQGDREADEYGLYLRLRHERLPERLIAYGVPSTSTHPRRQEVINRLAASVRVDDAFANAATGLALVSGFLRYDETTQSFEHVPHAAAHLARNKIDAVHQPAVEARNFRRLLLRAFGGDQVKMQAFIEFLACAVFGKMPPRDASRTGLVLVGPQRSGKSTIISLAKLFFLDEQITSLAPELWHKAENLVQLAGCSLNVVTELANDRALKGNIVKQVLSQEPIAARRMRQNLFTFTPRCANIWACNELPRLAEQHPSLLRRFMIVSMGETLTDVEAAEDFWGTLAEEASGFVNYLAESFVQVIRRGHFIVPPDSDLLVGRMQFGDAIAPLFARHHLRAEPGSRVTTEGLWPALRRFASMLGLADEAVHTGTLKELASLMATQFGAVRKKSNGRPFYLGVALHGISASPDEGSASDTSLADL